MNRGLFEPICSGTGTQNKITMQTGELVTLIVFCFTAFFTLAVVIYYRYCTTANLKHPSQQRSSPLLSA
ncbi:unnamed protein product, partial [Mesorhabditis belari]|uniref:Uncharacterized protein n=1 Tax=Mesorhabditis belari TaxID=2138241 RepID=A0AAF3FG87_9BILA